MEVKKGIGEGENPGTNKMCIRDRQRTLAKIDYTSHRRMARRAILPAKYGGHV